MKWNSSWLMVLCVVGMGAFFFLPVLGVSLSGLLGVGLILLCPLSHLLMIMMRGVHSGGQNCHQEPATVSGTVADGGSATPERAAPRSLPVGSPLPAIAVNDSEPVSVGRGEG